MNALDPFLHRTRVAYFSMEIALRPEVHTYSGGLGVLAGDTARSAADLDLPMVFVTLLSRNGYVRQEVGPQGNQIDLPSPWIPEDWASPLPAMVAVSIEGRSVWVRPWLYVLTCPIGNSLPVLLLDTDLDQNSLEDRQITDRLYGGDEAHRVKQEIVLGIGGALLLRALGFNIRTYHLNEGHAALLALQLLRDTRRPGDVGSPSLYDRASVRERCVFTTHTPVEAGFDRFDYGLVNRLLGDFFGLAELKALAGEDRLNMTRLALNLSGYVNGVARRHAETASGMFPGYQIRSITNGVHVHTWVHANLARLFEARFPHWAHEPEVIALADQIPDGEIWTAHQAAKVELLGVIKERTGTQLQLDVPVIGFARRMTSYKRPNLLL
ncbi:alpha-glucan family phosphorylase, partial [Devosia sp.]|uniref:alpha-glucan family phosphorylase n=1 Tax=Devosia sp. TaxID=1871048 RepID=UPI0025BE3125